MSAAVMQAPNLAVNPVIDIKSEDFARQLNLMPVRLRAPVYKQRKFNQASGASTLTISGNVTQSQFNIPGEGVWNFHKSYMTMDASFPIGANPSINSVFTDCFPIDSIQLLANNSLPIAYLTNVQPYTKVSQALAIDLDEYSSRGPVYGDTILGTAYPLSQITGCQPCSGYQSNFTATIAAGTNVPVNAATIITAGIGGVATMTFGTAVALTVAGNANNRTTAQLLPNRPSDASIIDVLAGGDIADVASANPANQASGTDVNGRLAPQKLVSGALEAGGGEGVLQVRFRIPLKAFLGTILAMDRDLYFGGQNLQLIVNWKPLANWGFNTVGVAAAASVALAVPTITKYSLFLMEDVNAENVTSYKNEVKDRGMQIIMPYTDCSQLTSPDGAGTFTMSTQITPGKGLSLKRCITMLINGANTTKRTANNFNARSDAAIGDMGVKFSQNQSSLDGRPLQDQFLEMANSDQWNYVYRLIRDSPAGLSQRTYEENCFMLDNFSDADSSVHFYENDCKDSGLKVSQQMTYENTFVKTAIASLTALQYQTYSRILIINRDGISFGKSR